MNTVAPLNDDDSQPPTALSMAPGCPECHRTLTLAIHVSVPRYPGVAYYRCLMCRHVWGHTRCACHWSTP